MTMTAEKIITEALALAPQARAYLIERLIESLDMHPGAELSSQWGLEIQKRCQEIDEGTVKLRDAAVVFAEAYTNLE